jgi:hypothetical protein
MLKGGVRMGAAFFVAIASKQRSRSSFIDAATISLTAIAVWIRAKSPTPEPL